MLELSVTALLPFAQAFRRQCFKILEATTMLGEDKASGGDENTLHDICN
jgi:hypothetical protein